MCGFRPREHEAQRGPLLIAFLQSSCRIRAPSPDRREVRAQPWKRLHACVSGRPASLPQAVPEHASPGAGGHGPAGVLRCQERCLSATHGRQHVTASLRSFKILKAEGLAVRPLLYRS